MQNKYTNYILIFIVICLGYLYLCERSVNLKAQKGKEIELQNKIAALKNAIEDNKKTIEKYNAEISILELQNIVIKKKLIRHKYVPKAFTDSSRYVYLDSLRISNGL